MNQPARRTFPDLPLEIGIRSRRLATATGLEMHLLENGAAEAPLLLLLHGFPEIAYSWRKLMRPLAEAGYYMVAPDLRGYGRTTGWDDRYDGDLHSFAMPNLVRDLLGLLQALDRPFANCVVGHDFGAPLAAWSTLLRPDRFRAAILMSAPFGGPPSLAAPDPNPDAMLATLVPPRKHYQWYYCTPAANRDMLEAAGGLSAFLRAYYHMKSADWADNQPAPLAGWSAEELARLPEYYVMRASDDMPSAVRREMPDAATVAACEWLTEDELAIYASEYARTGFQGGLNWYRTSVTPAFIRDLAVYAGRRIEVPVGFIAGEADWGYRQGPGALESMATEATADFRGTRLIPGAGHWVQQEQPRATTIEILRFLDNMK